MNALLLVAGGILPIILTLLLQRCAFTFKKKATYHRLVHRVKYILHPASLTLQEMLYERSQSNQRLVRALGLSNTFVSEEEAVHKDFVTRARRLLSTAQRKGWRHFQTIACEATQWQLQCSQQPFDSLIQNITLVVILAGILGVEGQIQSVSHEDIALVAKNITALWALSKKPDPIPPHLLEQLTEHLRHLVPDEETFPTSLDFVVPAWETLWRVVATTVAYSHDNEEIRGAFAAFSACPTDETFRGGEESDNVDVKSVVAEAMRLHPPSKHIGRSKKRVWCPAFVARWLPSRVIRVNQNADIAALPRSEDVWGPDADVFLPRRHNSQHILPQQREALTFAFGHGPLRCVAASWAPMAAAVISGAVLDYIGSDGYVLEAGRHIGGRAGWNGWLLRKSAE
ncbi:hypothetical protein BDZ97DRAFT_1380323 [Flammula alnicola]|nr:hypothetical protein BDZ97DRAFT_1380323 [Flammula alnicola]